MITWEHYNWTIKYEYKIRVFVLHTLRKTAFPQRSSLSEVNWWRLHLFRAQLATSYSLSVQLHSTSNIGLTVIQTKVIIRFNILLSSFYLNQIQSVINNNIIPKTSSSAPPWKSSGVIELYIDIVMLCSITFFCSVSICSSYFY